MNSKQSGGPKWKTKTGDVINVSDMTNTHIQNAVNYLRCQKSLDVKSMEILLYEIDRREKKAFKEFLERTKKCPYCKIGVAYIKEYNPEDKMFIEGYVFSCNSCPYVSGFVSCPSKIFTNPPSYEEISYGRGSYYDSDFYEQNF